MAKNCRRSCAHKSIVDERTNVRVRGTPISHLRANAGATKSALSVAMRLRQETVKKRRGKLTPGVLFMQDNAPAHTSQYVTPAVTKCSLEILPHPQYSPDLAP